MVMTENKNLCVFLKIIFIYLFMAVLSLGCYTAFSLVAESRGYSLVVVRASHCGGAWTLGGEGFGGCGSWALQHRLNS